MDRGARERVVRRVGVGMAALLLLSVLLVAVGCHQDERGGPAIPQPGPEKSAGDNTVVAVPEWLPPAVVTEEAKEKTGTLPADITATDRTVTDNTVTDYTVIDNTTGGGRETVVTSRVRRRRRRRNPTVSPPHDSSRNGLLPSSHKPKSGAAPHPVATASPKDTRDASSPGWAKSPEELVYRVDFIGITMGYARFRYLGKVSIEGKPAYHLNVRAWTSGVLSFIYPINETIDYYLDAETIAPIRQEFTQREKEKDDVALYDQETGKITYRYRQSGKIRKQVTTIPSVYDPVSVAYYFRWKDLGVENRPRNMYGGRKVYQISTHVLGKERIHTEHGEVDTVAVVPVIRRDGKPDDKGDLKIWFSDDERRVPVRLYAKFRKIKDWTLVGELIPPAGKAGG